MAHEGRTGDLEIAEDHESIRHGWLVQRFGWALMGLLVAAGLAGIFGAGPLSRASVHAAGVSVDYPRLARRTHTSEIRIALAAPAADTVRIAIDSQLLEGVELRDIVPVPVRTDGGPDGTVFVFGPTQRIVFRIKPERAGRLSGRLVREGVEPIPLAIFVYP